MRLRKIIRYLKKALEEHKTLVHRSELLHELFSKKFSIAVAGSHGKTTTTAMTGQIFTRVR